MERDGIALIVNGLNASELANHMRALAAQGPANAVKLASRVANKLLEKHHIFLDDELLSVDYASSGLDPDSAWQAAVRLAAQLGTIWKCPLRRSSAARGALPSERQDASLDASMMAESRRRSTGKAGHQQSRARAVRRIARPDNSVRLAEVYT